MQAFAPRPPLAPTKVRPAVAAWAATLPDKLCALGPANLSVVAASPVAPQLCPLTASQWAGGAAGEGVPPASVAAAAAAALKRQTAVPETPGGAAILLVTGDENTAAALQGRLCDVLHKTRQTCGFALPLPAAAAGSAAVAVGNASAAAQRGAVSGNVTAAAVWAAAPLQRARRWSQQVRNATAEVGKLARQAAGSSKVKGEMMGTLLSNAASR